MWQTLNLLRIEASSSVNVEGSVTRIDVICVVQTNRPMHPNSKAIHLFGSFIRIADIKLQLCWKIGSYFQRWNHAFQRNGGKIQCTVDCALVLGVIVRKDVAGFVTMSE